MPSYNYPPGYNNGAPQTPPPNSYMVWAILTTILCCLPFGIVAIVYASKVDGLWWSGNHMGALDAANKAKNWSIAAAVTGGAAGLISAICYAIYGAAIVGAAAAGAI